MTYYIPDSDYVTFVDDSLRRDIQRLMNLILMDLLVQRECWIEILDKIYTARNQLLALDDIETWSLHGQKY